MNHKTFTTSILTVVSLIFLGCGNTTEPGKFTVTGEIKNAPDQDIYLEQLFFVDRKPEVLDTLKLKGGKFSASIKASEQGLYRIRFSNDPRLGLFFINDANKIVYKGDLKSISTQPGNFKTPANEQLVNFIKKRDEKRGTFETINDELNKIQPMGNDSLMAATKNRLYLASVAYEEFMLKYIDTCTHPLIALFAVNSCKGMDAQLLEKGITGMPKRFPGNKDVESLAVKYAAYMAQQKSIQQQSQSGAPVEGSMAPDFTMNDVNDKPVSLSSFKGKYVLIDFWASWCGPCRGENPNVVAAYNKFKTKNFTILGVSLDESRDKWLQAIKADNLTWTQVSDLKGWNNATVALYGYDGIPYNVLIDPAGKIIATGLRGEELQGFLEKTLK